MLLLTSPSLPEVVLVLSLRLAFFGFQLAFFGLSHSAQFIV